MSIPKTLRRHRRTLVRCCALAAAGVLLAGLLPWPESVAVVPAMSPYVSMSTTIATRSVAAIALAAMPVLIVVLLRRRWFCRWLCPVGLVTEGAGRLSPVSVSCKRVPPIGKALVLISIAAACAGFPLLLWLDPLALFSGLFGVAHEPLRAAAQVSAAVLAGVLVLSFVMPGVWCRKLCPLGATQELLAIPAQRLSRRQAFDGTHVGDGEQDTPRLARRSVLAVAVGAVCAGLGARLGSIARAHGEGRPPATLRPPGAVPPWQFPQLCLRCGNCARACPAGIIRPDWQGESIAGWLTPLVAIDDDYCREDCCACMLVCPSRAIARGNLETKRERPIGLAHVDLDRCLLAQDRECRTMCLEVCPYEAIVLHEWTWEDDRRYPIIGPQMCPGCGACVLACSPMDAITVLPPGVRPCARTDSRSPEEAGIQEGGSDRPGPRIIPHGDSDPVG